MKKFIVFLSATLLGCLSFAAFAEGGYLGASFGYTEVVLDGVSAGAGTTLDDKD